MKFDLLFPNVEAGKMPTDYITRKEYEGLPKNNDTFRTAHYLKAKKTGSCWVCKEQTHWIEINFEGHCCSEECDDLMWKEYEDACKASDLKHGENEEFI